MAYTYHPSTQEAEAGASRILAQPELGNRTLSTNKQTTTLEQKDQAKLNSNRLMELNQKYNHTFFIS